MIELKAKTRGDHTVLEISIKGTAEEIGIETAHIVTKLPERLLDECRPAFKVMQSKVLEISEEVRKECEDRLIKELEEQDDKRN